MPEKSVFSVQQGMLLGAQFIPSPNFNQRPKETVIQLVVIHNISLPPNQFGGGYIQQFFQNQLDWNAHPYFKTIEGMQVSAHVLILRTGEVLQFVNLNDRAWHAGRSSYLGKPECNDYSIGIELEGSDDQAFTEIQYQSLASVVAALQQTYPSILQHITGHSDIAPQRKTDPGVYFDWNYFRGLLNKEKT
ncbi:1,6-anhydro-N-acetylmuramyl-L-alanine amidase AmpD [Acinetobacter sp. MD2]|uniref:1,6-anhydro-N-acetylmuramyl-L-alanine amidase AmpD n=1 Tax=Acinetobacter sp. MD2 TaxID=2600066 RepID=UPI002D1E6E53|nr:1,6-anhydro-N-acetylmuramyl-L-alanine amidase AmpD [Acinetobacter sp. MD2]MEB3767366.1 1,6-anhydro-N-acetylmuramyl-L-alanine amidase AmpD [Acinetobacter sp. MD2]